MARRNRSSGLLIGILVSACVLLVLTLTVVLNMQTDNTTRPTVATARQKPAKSLVGSVLASISGPSIALENCSFDYGIWASLNRSGYNYEFTADVTNNTRSAVDSLIFYIRSRDLNRTVPIGECLDLIDIPSGIEPGETRQVKFHASFSEFGNFDYPQPPSAPFEVAIVDEHPGMYAKLYQHFSNVKMFPVIGDYSTDSKPDEDGFFRDILESDAN